MEIIFDYIHWKKNNEDILKPLTETSSIINARWIFCYRVLEHLAKIAEKRTLTRDEENTFVVGYGFLSDRIEYLQLLYKRVFDNSISEMLNFAETINLLLYIMEFEEDLLETDPDYVEGYKLVFEFGQDVLVRLERKEHCLEHIKEFSFLIDRVYLNWPHEVNLIGDLYYEIADYYGLLEEDSADSEDMIN